MIYQVRIKNILFGYFSDGVHDIEAPSVDEALKIASLIDPYADCTAVGSIEYGDQQ